MFVCLPLYNLDYGKCLETGETINSLENEYLFRDLVVFLFLRTFKVVIFFKGYFRFFCF